MFDELPILEKVSLDYLHTTTEICIKSFNNRNFSFLQITRNKNENYKINKLYNKFTILGTYTVYFHVNKLKHRYLPN